ncbi:DUF4270 family protein [Arcticibacterium luteifluviistationis]|nr:DUF4270 family protein [Arcticibacterium luteifluviistationis]
MRNSVLVLISAFFFSCEEPSNIGFEGGEGTEQTYFTDTLAVESSTYLMDSAITSGQSSALVGSFTDPLYGEITSVAYLQPALVPDIYGTGQTPLTISENSVFDSLKLSLINRTVLFYGDSTSSITIQVHRLKESLEFGKNYNYDDEQAYDATPLVSKTLTRENFYNPADSTIPYIKLKLPDAIGEELLALANKDASATNEAFTKAFKGFRISALSGTKTLTSFNLGSVSSDGVSALEFYSHTPGGTTSDGYVFEFTTARYNQITSDRSGTLISSLTQKTLSQSSSLTGGNTYVQAGTGLASKLTFPGIAKLNNPQVSRAELEFRADTTTFDPNISLTQFITFIKLGNSQQVTRINGVYDFVNYGLNPTTGILTTYVDSTNLFIADITPYLQDIASKKNKDNGMILVSAAPTDATLRSGTVYNSQLNRILLKDFKLNLYYSEK